MEPGERIIFRGHRSWLSMPRFVLKALALSLIAGVLTGTASTVADGRVHSGRVVLGVLGCAVVLAALGQIRRLRTTYCVTTRRVVIQRGLLMPRARQAPLAWVRDLAIRQSALGRMMGVGTVEFDVAAADGRRFTFRGVDEPGWIAGAVDHALHERERSRDAADARAPQRCEDVPAVSGLLRAVPRM